MAVRIRMNRMGRTNRPFYRIIVADSRSSRDGRAIERLGHYDPILKQEKNWVLNRERAAYWLSVGAQPSETVRSFLKKEGIWPLEKAVEFFNSIKDKPVAVEPATPELPADIKEAVEVESVATETNVEPVVAEKKETAAEAEPVTETAPEIMPEPTVEESETKEEKAD